MITISLPPEQRARLRGWLRRAGRREIGGLIMGEQLAVDHFRIVDLSMDDSTGSPAHFIRMPAAHQGTLSTFFERTGGDFRRFNYLGEWHSHPSFAVRPSRDDVRSMQELVDHEEAIEFSALLIVRLRFLTLIEARAWMFVRGREPISVRLSR